MNLGIFGRITFLFEKRNGEDTYDVFKSYKDQSGKNCSFKIGKTFPVKNRNGDVVEGLSECKLGLISFYDKDKEKNITSYEDGLLITTHKLKKPIVINDSLTKVGWITGKFVIEMYSSSEEQDKKNEQADNSDIDIDEDEIPF